MPPAGNAIRGACTGAGIAGIAAGCAGMAAMLPGAAAGAIGAIGIGGSSALARTLSPIAQPLFIASAILFILGALACSRLVAAAAVTGSTLLYLSMFQLASSATTNGHGSMSTMSMQQTHSRPATLHAERVTFYLGLASLAVGLGLTIWRRRRRACRPLLRLPQPSIVRR